MGLRPVQRIKHVVDQNSTITAASQLNFDVVATTDTPTLAATSSVITGAKVYGIYLKVLVASNEATQAGVVPNVYLTVFKNSGGNLTAPTANAVGANDNKRFVLHQEMSMLVNKISDIPTVLFNGVVKIPKTYNRFGPNDVLTISILCPLINITECLQCHFKEFR